MKHQGRPVDAAARDLRTAAELLERAGPLLNDDFEICQSCGAKRYDQLEEASIRTNIGHIATKLRTMSKTLKRTVAESATTEGGHK